MSTPPCNPIVVQPEEGRNFGILGTGVTLMLDRNQTGGSHYTFTGTIPAGAGIPPHVHEHEDEIAHILEGEFEVFLNGKRQKASAGAVLYFPRNIPHGFSNIGDTTARAFFVVSPGENFERFFVELSALPADQPPDMAKVVDIFGRHGLTLANPPA